MMRDTPVSLLWILLIASGTATAYYGAIVGGVFKDSLMGQFRKYGDENRIFPVCRLLAAAGIASFVIMLLLPRLDISYLRQLFPRSIFTLLAFTLWGASLFIFKQPTLRESLPRWYFDLLRSTSRQERRHIGYAWLRVPLMLRLRLNGDQQAFQVWSELVRLTVIYGAHDPNSPWDVWT